MLLALTQAEGALRREQTGLKLSEIVLIAEKKSQCDNDEIDV